MTPNRRPRILVLWLIATLINPFPWWGIPVVRADTVTVAPNLMVILGNSFSMNREMDDIHYPRYTRDNSNKLLVDVDSGNSPCPLAVDEDDPLYPDIPRFDDYGCDDEGTTTDTGRGTMAPYRLLGDQPTSKFYIAKQTLYNLLDSDVSDGINFGFATFRQAFGLEMATSVVTTNATWPYVHPDNENSILTNWTDSDKNTFGRDEKNFRNVQWWRIWLDYNSDNALFGKEANTGNDRWENGLIQSFISVPGGKGLPASVQYRRFPSGQGGVTCGESTCGQRSRHYYQGMDLADYCRDSSSGTERCWFGSGGVDAGLQANYPRNPEDPPKHDLCYTFYNSQGNFFQSAWVADKDFRQVFADRWSPEVRTYIYLNHKNFDGNGNISSTAWVDTCFNGANREFRYAQSRISNQLKYPDGSKRFAYFSYIPDIFEGADPDTLNQPVGSFTGWSGAASYDFSTNTYSASYPAGVASAAATAMGSWRKSTADHMGVFLDLPDPNAGYTDQRNTIKEWVNPAHPQMDPSGEEYNPATQTLQTPSGEKRSISPSILPGGYKSTQSPIYDSLMDAAAYFRAYKTVDSYDACRSNNILLIIDGKEDGHYSYDGSGNKVFANPAAAARKLYNELNVKVHVVIISSNSGNIQQADAIAAAGGTGQAYHVSNAQDLTNAMTAVFTSLQGTVVTAGASVVPSVSGTNADLVYVPASDFTTGGRQGHLYAYHIAANGQIGDLQWDAAAPDLMTVALRTAHLQSNKTDGDICLFNDSDCVADSDLQATGGTPSASDIRSYTLDPNYNNGAYLSGRQSGSLVGTISTRAMKPLYVDRPRSERLADRPDFRGYVQANANWRPLLLFSSDDGFLYAVDAKTGALEWGWMPRPLLGELKNYAGFQQGKPMDGGLTLGYSKGDGNWKTYLVGTADSGALHYVLRIAPDNQTPVLNKRIAVDQQNGASSPHAASPALWNDSNGVGYAFYVTNPTTGNARVSRVRLHDGYLAPQVLPSKASSNVVVSDRLGAVLVGLYDGRIVTLDAANLGAPREITTATNGGALVGAVTWVGTGSLYDGTTYLWATTDANQIAVYRWEPQSSTWKIQWTTKAGGPSTNGYDYNSNNSDGRPVEYTSDPGSNGAGPRWLPADARITDASVIDSANGVLLVPGSQSQNQQLSCGSGNAKLYLFRLSDGKFPTRAYTDTGQEIVTDDVEVGEGEAYTPTITRRRDGTRLIIPAAQQNTEGEAKPAHALVGAAPSGRRVSWREIIF